VRFSHPKGEEKKRSDSSFSPQCCLFLRRKGRRPSSNQKSRWRRPGKKKKRGKREVGPLLVDQDVEKGGRKGGKAVSGPSPFGNRRGRKGKVADNLSSASPYRRRILPFLPPPLRSRWERKSYLSSSPKGEKGTYLYIPPFILKNFQ